MDAPDMSLKKKEKAKTDVCTEMLQREQCEFPIDILHN